MQVDRILKLESHSHLSTFSNETKSYSPKDEKVTGWSQNLRQNQELCVVGTALALGYTDPKRTAAGLVQNPNSLSEDIRLQNRRDPACRHGRDGLLVDKRKEGFQIKHMDTDEFSYETRLP